MSNYFYEGEDEEEDPVDDLPEDNSGDDGNPPEETERKSTSKKEIEKKGKEKAKQKAEKAVANNAKSMALKKAISHFLVYAFGILVIFIIVVGIIMFLVTMPGMVMEKLKQLFNAAGNYVAAIFGADTTEQIQETEMYETLDYLEDMGYDIKGEGFLTGYLDTEADLTEAYSDASFENWMTKALNAGKTIVNIFLPKDKELAKGEYVEDGSLYVDKTVGVIRNKDDDTIYKAESDFIFTYIMSDNYVYTLKNDNLATQQSADKLLEKITAGVGTAIYKYYNFGFSWLFDFFNITDAVGEKWGKGMIALYYDGGTIGNKNQFVNSGTLTNWDSIKINVDTKKLSINRKTLFDWDNNAIEFSLDGWTGRYGMPAEFLIAVHKATLMPDLAADMVSSFPTEIEVLLHPVSGEAVAGYKTSKGTYVDYATIQASQTGFEGRNIFTKLINEIDSWFETNGEVLKAQYLGVDVGTGTNGCTCEFEEGFENNEGHLVELKNGYWYYAIDVFAKTDTDGESTVIHAKGKLYGKDGEVEIKPAKIIKNACDYCREKLSGIIEYLSNANDYALKSYAPYISRVKNHWYRDVYFVINKNAGSSNNVDGKKFVEYDYDYEAVVKERWTLYETYSMDVDEDDYRYTDDVNKEGEFIYIEIDENGKYKKDDKGKYVVFNGTIEDARPSVLYEIEKDESGKPIKINGETQYVEYEGNRNNIEGKDLYRLNSFYVEGESDSTVKKYVKYTGDVAVSKKAVEMDVNEDNLKDLGWNKNSTNIWTAYEKEPTSSGFEPLFDEAQIAEEENEVFKEVMKNCYINLNITGNIVQVGEGLRTETNPEIKQMFLTNNYFRYDGTGETAEIVTALRNKVYEDRKAKNPDTAEKYGPITDDERETKVTIKKLENGKETSKDYYAKDYSGKVILSQDSLNAFSMLENTHTLDADYIYRDFKELVVELGYFEKEELVEESPRKLLQFPIPEIGSGGYPNRTIDKRNNEFGTMIHSKYDIEANEKNTAMYLLTKYLEFEGEGDPNAGKNSGNNTANGGVLASAWQDTQKIDSVLSSVGAITPEQAIEAGHQDTGDFSSSVSGITVDEFLAKAREICEYMDNEGYDYCVSDPEKCNHQVHSNSCGLPQTFEQSKALKNVCCATLVSWVLRDVGVNMDECENQNYCPTLVPYLVNQLGGEVIAEYSDLEPGDILCYIHTPDYEGSRLAHVDILGEEDGDGYLKYNGGHYVTSSNSSIGTFNKARYDSEYLCFGVRLFGNARKGENYEGYLGNEAVVSPVTGVLLAYGTYDEEDKDTGSEYPNRVNVDLKYGGLSVTLEELKDFAKEEDDTVKNNEPQANNANPQNNNEPQNNSEPQKTDDENARIVSEKVGYAKILVLDKENYKKMEAYASTKWSSDESNLLTKQGVYQDEINNEDDLKKLQDEAMYSALTTSVYGYKEFAERYEMAGISGYIITIDGFKTELPDEEFRADEEEEEKDPTKLIKDTEKPKGTPLTMESFKVSQLDVGLEVENEKIISLYEEPEEYKLASEKATEKLAVEELIKTETAPALTINDPNEGDIIFIKEGTVIGRTYTDREVVEDLRKEKVEDYVAPEKTPQQKEKDLKEGNANENKIIGNYLRVSMLNTKKEHVEDVENYMKLDEMETVNKFSDFSEEFLYWMCVVNEGMPIDNKSTFLVEHLNNDGMRTVGPGITMENAAKWFEAVGHPEYNTSTPLGTEIPKDIVIDAYLAWMDWYVEDIEASFDRTLNENETYAMCDYHHATGASFKGFGYHDGVVLKAVNAGSGEEAGFLKDCEYVKAEFKEAIKKRRIADWKVYSNGEFTFTYDQGETIIFDSDTPFQDALDGVNSGHK